MPTNELLLRAREAILRIVRVGDRLRDSPGGRQRVDRTEGAGELEGGEWIVLAGGWIRFRNDLWRKQAGEEITLRFVYGFVFALSGNQYGSVSGAQTKGATHVCMHRPVTQESLPSFA